MTTHAAHDTSYVTTSIPYVNANPHLGFALELCVADAFARHRRTRGRRVRFVTGTDDHSLKNVLAAERAGVPTAKWVAEHAAAFQALNAALDISADDFQRTSANPAHAPAVRAVGGLRSSRRPVPEAVPRAVLRRVRAVLRAGGARRRALSRARCPARDRRGDELVLPAVALRRRAARGDRVREASRRP